MGILRTQHTYGIEVPVPHSLGPEVSARLASTNAVFTIVEPPATVEAETAAEKYVTTIKLQMETMSEGDIAETVELFVASKGEESSGSLEILLTAKVVRCNRGTPLLKDGVHVLSHKHSDECTEWPGSYEESHVRFASGTHLDPEPIHLTKDPTSPFPEAHVGILRNHHTYSIDISIPHSLGPEVSAQHEPGNMFFTIMALPTTVESKTGAEKYMSNVRLQVKADADGDIAETMKLVAASEGEEPSESLEVLLTAKVIRCNQGNPLLKEGVRIISHQHTNECIIKEWPGTYEENRVRFASGTHLDPEPIRLAREDSTSLPPEAHVGILRNHHTYSVDIPIPHSLGPEVSASHHPDNTSFSVMEPPVTVVAKTGLDKYLSTVKLKVKTVVEGSIAEKMELFSAPSEEGGPSGSLEILLTAKVIRCNQGTPLLKDGVHVISNAHTKDCSEWPGFYEENHVRFASDTVLEPNPIKLTTGDDPTLPPEAHVGLLLNHHTYGVDIPIPHSLGPEVSARHASTNIIFTVTEPPETVQSARGNDEYLSTVRLQVKTVKEGNIAEKIEVYVGEGEGEHMEVVVTAMVIKNSLGTPLLKDGVHVISRQRSDESDFTEWQGFSKDAEEEMEIN